MFVAVLGFGSVLGNESVWLRWHGQSPACKGDRCARGRVIAEVPQGTRCLRAHIRGAEERGGGRV